MSTDKEANEQSTDSNIKVENEVDISVDKNISKLNAETVDFVNNKHSDPEPNTTVDFKTPNNTFINSLSNNDNQKNTDVTENCVNHHLQKRNHNENAELSSLDAALDNLDAQVSSLLDESKYSNQLANEKSPDAPLDEAIANLNNEVLGLLKESRKIQDELQKTENERKATEIKKINSIAGGSCSSGIDGTNKYFDYSLYRESSASPPPHPLITYRWEDIRRDKEKVNNFLLHIYRLLSFTCFASAFVLEHFIFLVCA